MHVVEIRVDKSLFLVETHRDDVLGIFFGEFDCLFHREALLEQKLLIIRQHDDERHVENVLQPFGELERDCVTNVHGIAARSTSSVDEEALTLLIVGQDPV